MEAAPNDRIAQAGVELKAIILDRVTGNGHFPTGIPGVFFVRRDMGLATEHRFDRPLASLIIQGSKKSVIGHDEYLLSANDALIVCVDMPSSSQLLDASEEKPFLSIYFHLDPLVIADLVIDLGNAGLHASRVKGISLARADADYMEGMLRLARLVYHPEQISLRGPMILRELHYLLLIGVHGNALRNLHGNHVCGQQIFKAIEYLRTHLEVNVRSEELAKAVHMSESTLYRNFKILTGLSPLQYHKQLKLHEARRIMLTENEQAGMAALKVGYESINQFNREYKRLFGQPPHRSKKHGS